MKTGIELIAIERQEQIEKHGKTVEGDIANNSKGELSVGAFALLKEMPMLYDFPNSWDKDTIRKMALKPKIDKLIIAGALISAEIDRLQAVAK